LNLENERVLASSKGHSNDVHSVQITGGGTGGLRFPGSDDKNRQVWDLQTEKTCVVGDIGGVIEPAFCRSAISPDGNPDSSTGFNRPNGFDFWDWNSATVPGEVIHPKGGTNDAPISLRLFQPMAERTFESDAGAPDTPSRYRNSPAFRPASSG